MTNSLVLQSHRQPFPAKWIATCTDSVKNWAELNKFEYQFLGDELFDYVSDVLLGKVKTQRVIATDLARLKVLQANLAKEYDTVVWCDADFLIFAVHNFVLPDDSYAIGREVWVQADDKDQQKLSAHIKVHNAFMMYRQGNPFLDFYTDTAERLLTRIEGPMPPQFIGPMLLTAIHNVAQCPVLETAGMLSPLVIKDIANENGPALELFQQKSPLPIAAANLCNSLFDKGEVSTEEIESCITVLLRKQMVDITDLLL